MKFIWIVAIASFTFSSCLKQSIPDAMLGRTVQQADKVNASLSYEINGTPVKVTVEDADNQPPGFRRLYCEKSGSYNFNALVTGGEFVYTFFTDSLKVGNYQYPIGSGGIYVTDFQGKAEYVYSPTDYLNFTITTYKDGHISGNFAGQLTPGDGIGFGAASSVVIKNGSFTNVPIFY